MVPVGVPPPPPLPPPVCPDVEAVSASDRLFPIPTSLPFTTITRLSSGIEFACVERT